MQEKQENAMQGQQAQEHRTVGHEGSQDEATAVDQMVHQKKKRRNFFVDLVLFMAIVVVVCQSVLIVRLNAERNSLIAERNKLLKERAGAWLNIYCKLRDINKELSGIYRTIPSPYDKSAQMAIETYNTLFKIRSELISVLWDMAEALKKQGIMDEREFKNFTALLY